MSVKLDMHVHSNSSPDSESSLESIVDAVGTAGLQGFALTDHNTVVGHGLLKKLRERYPRYWFIPGVEVSAQEGHVLAYGVDQAPPANRPLEETIEWIESHGGLAVLAHPLRLAHGVGAALARRVRVAAIETVNGHNSELANAGAEFIAHGRRLGTTGGSDAHHARSVGRAFTELSDEPASVEEILQAVRRGQVRASGRSLNTMDRLRLGLRTGALRAARGFRPI
jgi:predicted metal-dependent phosphoesterase TrpH